MKRNSTRDAAAEARNTAILQLRYHPVLALICEQISIRADTDHRYLGERSWIVVQPNGNIWLHPKRLLTPEEWLRLLALATVCLGFGLVVKRQPLATWELSSLLIANRFCDELKIGSLPEALESEFPVLPAGGAEALFRLLCTSEIHSPLFSWHYTLTGGGSFFINLEEKIPSYSKKDWKALLAKGIAAGVGRALKVAAGQEISATPERPNSPAQQAKRRLIDNYPLLGALAATFDLEEDHRLCQQYGIQVAAIDVGARKIWMNPGAHLNSNECLFVFTHELLHAGLNHASRRRGRDPQLWNVACDFIINAWLIEMGIGSPPGIGLLHDAKFHNWSAEEIYDDLAKDIRRARKLATLRGAGQPDLIGDEESPHFTDAERYCRRALAQGLERCLFSGMRGTLPAGLIEEIRSLNQPPIPWDVKLAEWFDERFPPPETRRSYARPSRRQASTPDIPRPSALKPPEEERKSRVFGVVLDTSGSMDTQLLGKALGAIASYAMARDVFAVRFISCDASAYDHGWVEPENLLDRFSIRGRGGTILQPGIDLIEAQRNRAEFPKEGPVLIITDGFCEDQLHVSMDHAFLLPEGRRLPFYPKGKVFSVS